MSQIVLELKGISKTFPGVKALNEMQLQIYAGEVHALMGENGAGKSTLMNIINGSYQKDSGEIYMDGRLVEIRSINDAAALGISMIHQELNYVPALTVADNSSWAGSSSPASGCRSRRCWSRRKSFWMRWKSIWILPVRCAI